MAAPLLVVDTPYFLFRAFHSLPDSIVDGDGRPVNALLGAVNAILAAVAEHSPRAVVCCFGDEAAAYRVQLYAGYHADREPAPGPLDYQFEAAPDFLAAFGFAIAYEPGLEADDLLGSLARVEERAGGEALILTGDRDMFQCATDRVRVLYAAGRGGQGPAVVGPAEVRERYGVDPGQVPDFIALRGDPSDGLPGAPGIGDKTAASLLRSHGDLEGVLAAAAAGKAGGRVSSTLAEHADELRDFREIALLRELDIDRPPDAPLDTEGGATAARALGMNRLAERLEGM